MTARTDTTLRVAAVQMNSGPDKPRNVARAVELLHRAADQGAQVAALPEEFDFLGRDEDIPANAEPIPGPTIEAVAAVARERGIYVLAGSIIEAISGSDKVHNTSVLLDPDGEIVARYRKIHLFDIDVPGQVSAMESAAKEPGDRLVMAKTPLASFGFSVCYDLRFPELYRSLALAGAEVVFSPAAFALFTGKDHWELLVRTRALENTMFMVAPAQFGRSPGFHSFGSAMIVDPWGTVLARAPEREAVVVADLDLADLARVRASLPSLEHRRPDVYDL